MVVNFDVVKKINVGDQNVSKVFVVQFSHLLKVLLVPLIEMIFSN